MSVDSSNSGSPNSVSSSSYNATTTDTQFNTTSESESYETVSGTTNSSGSQNSGTAESHSESYSSSVDSVSRSESFASSSANLTSEDSKSSMSTSASSSGNTGGGGSTSSESVLSSSGESSLSEVRNRTRDSSLSDSDLKGVHGETAAAIDPDGHQIGHHEPLDEEREEDDDDDEEESSFFSGAEYSDSPEPLTKKELWGWWFYDISNSVWSSVAIVGYLPLLLNELAKRSAGSNCLVRVGESDLSPPTISTTFLSFSVLFQFFAFVFFGAMADFGSLRKKLLLVCAFSGGVITVGMCFILEPEHWFLFGILLVISNMLFGLSIVFYNAFLPLIVVATPKFQKVLHSKPHDAEKIAFEETRITDFYSNRGFLYGFVSGVIVLLITLGFAFGTTSEIDYVYECEKYNPPIVNQQGYYQTPLDLVNVTVNNIFLATNGTGPINGLEWIVGNETYYYREQSYEANFDSTLSYRLSIGLAGLCWIFLTIPTMLWLKERPGPALPKGENYFSASVSNIWSAVKEVRRYPNAFRMALAFFIYSDSYSSIATIAVLFASDEFNSSAIILGLLLVLAPLMAGVGVFVFGKIQVHWNIPAKKMIFFHLINFIVLCVYVCLGFIDESPIGLKSEVELIILATFYGLHLGPIQTFSRSLYSVLVPKGKETLFFSIYEISDKGSSWMGPLVIGALNQAFGSMRYGIIYIFGMIVVSMPFLYFVDEYQGQIDAGDIDPPDEDSY